MSVNKVFLDPLNEMILEDPLDQLMKKVRGDDGVDIGTRKPISKRLRHK
jgi:hypothetical protein